jgi:hypothetical protein
MSHHWKATDIFDSDEMPDKSCSSEGNTNLVVLSSIPTDKHCDCCADKTTSQDHVLCLEKRFFGLLFMLVLVIAGMITHSFLT